MLLKRNDRSFRIGLTIAVIMAAMALIGYVWTPYDPTAIVGSQKFLPPPFTTCSAPTASVGISSAG